MLRLFEVVQGNKVMVTTQNKMAAKEARNAIDNARVRIGPDHWRYGMRGANANHPRRARGKLGNN